MSDGMDVEAITDTVEQTLRGESGFDLKQVGFGVASLSDLGEIFLRTPGGATFKMTIEAVSPEDVEGWGISFED